MDERVAGGGDRAAPHETTAVLIARARAGDTLAGQRLFARLLPALRRWARYRFPSTLRDARDTEDRCARRESTRHSTEKIIASQNRESNHAVS